MKSRSHLLALLLCACGSASAPDAQSVEEIPDRFVELQLRKEAPLDEAPAAPASATEGYAGGGASIGGQIGARGAFEKGRGDDLDAKDAEAENKPAEPEAAPTRAWFPETFLFEPLVVTDASGHASVDARVPDRLSSYRILALASSREGGLAGSVTSFLATLPVYVDPVVPPTLMAGDRLSLPVQVVNTTSEARDARLTVVVSGAATGGGGGQVHLAPGGSAVVNVPVNASGTGAAHVVATLEGADAIDRTLEVLPSGRPDQTSRGGTLAAPRTLQIAAPEAQDPGTTRVRLVVYPGALAVLRAEIDGAAGRGGLADDAYALLLAGQGPGLLRALGEEPDAEATRRSLLLATQRAMRETLAPDVATATLFAEAALASPENPVLARLGERLLTTLEGQQRPDGTFGGETGWTVQRLLMATSEAVAAVNAGAGVSPAGRQRAARVRLRASSAFERLGPTVEDPCTSAAMLTSGAVPDYMREKLYNRVREAVTTKEDGSRALPVPEGVLRSDGSRPSEAECTALAALALQGDPKATWLPDLGATLLADYGPGWGWGDGRADLTALRAVLAIFKDPVPDGVAIRLLMDGEPVLEGRLDGEKRKEMLVLDAPAPNAGGEHTWTVEASPAVPGLGYQLSLRTWGPWPPPVASPGATLTLDQPRDLARGQAGDLTIRALAPAGQDIGVDLALPAGLQVDTEALAAEVQGGRLQSWDSADGRLSLELPAISPGSAAEVHVRVIPTLAGTLRSGASVLRDAHGVGGGHALVTLPPQVWTVR